MRSPEAVSPWSLAHSSTAAATLSALAGSLIHVKSSRSTPLAPTFARYLFASLPLNLHLPYMPKFWANEIVGSAEEGGGLTPLSWLVKVIVFGLSSKVGAAAPAGVEEEQPIGGVRVGLGEARRLNGLHRSVISADTFAYFDCYSFVRPSCSQLTTHPPARSPSFSCINAVASVGLLPFFCVRLRERRRLIAASRLLGRVVRLWLGRLLQLEPRVPEDREEGDAYAGDAQWARYDIALEGQHREHHENNELHTHTHTKERGVREVRESEGESTSRECEHPPSCCP